MKARGLMLGMFRDTSLMAARHQRRSIDVAARNRTKNECDATHPRNSIEKNVTWWGNDECALSLRQTAGSEFCYVKRRTYGVSIWIKSILYALQLLETMRATGIYRTFPTRPLDAQTKERGGPSSRLAGKRLAILDEVGVKHEKS